MPEGAKKVCFVVTPIGSKDDPIRRHIEGIIDYAITPALEGKYEVEVAHRKYDIGSINDRVIKSIYDADLVIANLTALNPNVMFELAIRYSFGKPAIVIAEQGTQLPFDIIDENTIFYDNDPTGAYVLKEQLIKFETNIDYYCKQYGPVYKALGRAALYNEIESGKNVSNEKMLRYIADKLDVLEIKDSKRKVSPDRFSAANLSFKGYDRSNTIYIETALDFVATNRYIKEIKCRLNDICFIFNFPLFSANIDEIIQNYATRTGISEEYNVTYIQ